MKKRYVLIKLSSETVRELKKRQQQLGRSSPNELIVEMIRVLDDRNAALKCTGWQNTGGVIGG